MQGRALRVLSVPLTRILRAIRHNCVFAAYAAALRPRGGEPNGSPSSCESPSPPSGRAARAEVSDAFRLPPGSCYTAGMILAAAPEGAPAPEPAGLSAVSKRALWNLHSAFLLFIRKHLNIKCFTDLEKQIKGGCFPPALDLINISLCPVDHFPQLRLRQPLFLAPPAEQCTIINHFTLLHPSP